MAYMTNTRGEARTDIQGRTGVFFKAIGLRLEQYKVYRNTCNELNALTDRELSDLGINRSMIQSIATEAAYGKA